MSARPLYPSWVERQLCEATDADPSLVRELSRLAKHVVDRFVADDGAVLAPPLLACRAGDPVVERTIELLRDPSWEAPEGLWTLDVEEIGRALDLDPDTVGRFPVMNEIHIMLEMIDHAGYGDHDPEVEMLENFVYAWLDTWDSRPGRGRPRRRYSTSTVGSMEKLQSWFIANSGWVGSEHLGLGPLLEVVDGSGLLFSLRKSESGEPEHALVTLHAGMVDEALLEPILERQERVTVEGAAMPPDRWLIADGLTIEAEERLLESACGYLSLAEVGYRAHLFDEGILDVSDQPDPDPVRVRETCVVG